MSAIERLRDLKLCFNEELISQEDYDECKRVILRKMKMQDYTPESKTNDTPSNIVTNFPKKLTEGKLYLITKPEQAGKTNEVLTKMVTSFKKENTISIIFCDNSLLQVAQTKHRGDTFEGLGEICEISSAVTKKNVDKDGGDARNAADLFYKFRKPTKISTIVCCAHAVQLHLNIDQFLADMTSERPQYNFEIYIDEASKVAISEKMCDLVRKWENLSNVGKIYFIDATPEDSSGKRGLFTTYGELKLASLTTGALLSADYVGVGDFNHVPFEPLIGEDNVGYAKRILDADPLKNDDYAFIPAGHKQESHELMCQMLIEKGAVVVVLNGAFKGTKYRLKGSDGVTKKHTIEFEKKMMTTSAINDIIKNTAWELAKKYGKPLVITGGIVPGRGLSLQKPGLIFTRGIFGPFVANTNMDRSQAYGRLKGNIRSWVGYTKVKVHSSKKFHMGCIHQEETSRWLLQQGELGEEGYETKMNNDTVQKKMTQMSVEMGLQKEARGEPTIKKFFGEDGQIQGKEWYVQNLKKVFSGTRGPNIKVKNVEGKFNCTIRGDEHIYSTEEMNRNKGYGLGKNEKFRFNPCYRDTNDVTTLEWWLIYFVPKDNTIKKQEETKN
tara:strand:+ start:759 stop:2591 length:1833 start_codon:yes stop_codon:yes gene_type:complete